MKLHTDTLTTSTIFHALADAKAKGNVARDVFLVVFHPGGSRSRQRGFEIQLGASNKTSGPTRTRHYKNSGQYGADSTWAASYDEWGWFIAELYLIDPNAIFGPYRGERHFHGMTEGRYAPVVTG